MLLLIAAILSACASNHRASRLWDASSITDYPDDFRLTFRDKPKGKVVATVNVADIKNAALIKQRIENAAGELRTNFLVSDDTQPNGFSFVGHGGRNIAITIGMIKLLGQDDAAMAALFGHELAHLYLEHGNMRQNREENRVMSSVALSFALGMVGIPAPSPFTDAATATITNAYSRDDERDADRFGMMIMAHAGFDPEGAVRLQEKLGGVYGDSNLAFMSTHPTSSERVENMKRLALENRPDIVPTLAEKLEN
ncbi:MAG: M48 family metalloprotease [Nitrosomonadales bacterium]|nr:M48 family metalloprotease [Nitrosomonadales bacterium]